MDIYTSAMFFDPKTAPPGYRMAKAYGEPLALTHPDVKVAARENAAALSRRMQQLAALGPSLRAVLLRSHDHASVSLDPEAGAALVLDQGVPVVWSYVAVEEGIMVGLPGGPDTYPADYDPRTRPWYETAKANPGPRWDTVDVDESGQGLTVTCSMALHDDAGAFLGVAAVDFTFGWFIDNLLADEALPDSEALLVDGEGRVMVRSSQRDAARQAEAYDPPALPWPDAAERIAAERSGFWEDGDTVFAWARLQAVDWTYLVAASAEGGS